MPVILIVDPHSSSQIEVTVRDGLPVNSPPVRDAIMEAVRALHVYNVGQMPLQSWQNPAEYGRSLESCFKKSYKKPEGPSPTEGQKAAFVANRDAGMTFISAAKAAGFVRTIEPLRRIYSKAVRTRKTKTQRLLLGCYKRLLNAKGLRLDQTIEGDQIWTPERQYAEDYATDPPR